MLYTLTFLDPDQGRHFVGSDLGPNCLQNILVEDNGRQRVKMYSKI